jgi:S1-C subfamily serine protease
VASVVRETTNYLLERAEPLTVTGAALTSPTRSDGNSQRRRVSFGTVPDFAWQGPGVKVESVVPGSPAALAGIGPGDVIMAIDGQSITDLGAFSAMLKKYAAGDRITAAGEREGEVFEVELELVAR